MRRLRVAGLLAVLVPVVFVVTRGGGKDYEIKLPLENAAGLKAGGEVRLGGVKIGTVKDLELDDRDRVTATLKLDEGEGPIGRGASATVTAVNLLGQKFVDLDRGRLRQPLPSGTTIPRSKIGTPVDLDQVLDVLDADTRTRLQVLINEAGIAFTGRRADFNTTLRLLPPSVQQLGRILTELNANGRTLDRLVVDSDTVIGEFAAKRQGLSRLVDSAGQAAQTVVARRAELAHTLRQAPQTIRSLQRFLTDLDSTARPLGPAARRIAATATPLTDTLRVLGPVRAAAQPALRQATAIAPSLGKLATKATPVLTQTRDTASKLEQLVSVSAPLLRTLNVSVDDVFAILEGWALTIQGRDGLAHTFRVRANVNADLINSIVSRLGPTPSTGAKKKSLIPAALDKLLKPTAPTANATPAPSAQSDTSKKKELGDVTKPALDSVKKLLSDITGGAIGQQPGPAPSDGKTGAAALLDFLLGP